MEEKEKNLFFKYVLTSCFDNVQKIDEINAENISNIIFQEKVLWKKNWYWWDSNPRHRSDWCLNPAP